MQGIAGRAEVREVVLNEGFRPPVQARPNTILGVNTIFGMEGVGGLVNKFSDTIKYAINKRAGKALCGKSVCLSRGVQCGSSILSQRPFR